MTTVYPAAMSPMPGSGRTTMAMPLLPDWLTSVWVVALCVVLVLHAQHVYRMSGATRRWHIGHTLMAAGMIVMYLVDQQAHPALYWGGVVLFGALAAVALIVGASMWRRDRLLNWVWAAATLDLLAMTYMFLPMSARDAGLSYAFIAYLAVETVTWLSNPLPRLFVRESLATPPGGTSGEMIHAAAADGGETITRTRPAATAAATCESIRLVADVTVGVRMTLAVMSAAMGWMLVAMQTMQVMHMTMSG